MAFVDEVNYEKISQLNKKERKSSNLTPLDPEFYTILITHLKNLQEEYNKKFPGSSRSTEALLINNEICKLDSMIGEIYTRRERKIILSALDTDQNPNRKNMLKHELHLYENISGILNEFRDEILDQRPKPSCAEIEQSVSHTEPIQGSAPVETEQNSNQDEIFEPDSVIEPVATQNNGSGNNNITDQPEPGKRSNETSESDVKNEELDEQFLIYVLEDLEPFVGTDSITYELKKEEMATIPKNIAEILIKNNKVRLVESNL